MARNVCIYKGTTFETGSHEHILQASLGAKWESNTLICEEMQQHFANSIDRAVAGAVAQLRTLFGTKHGRGYPPATLKNVKTEEGSSYHVKPGMQPVMTEPSYEIEEKDGQTRVKFSLADSSQIGWAIAKFKKENPTWKLDEKSIGEGIPPQMYLQTPLHF